jgi:hypothetical protein
LHLTAALESGRDRVAMHGEHIPYGSRSRASVRGAEHGGFEGVDVDGSGATGERALFAGVAVIALFALGVPAVFDCVGTSIIGVGQHESVCITQRTPLPKGIVQNSISPAFLQCGLPLEWQFLRNEYQVASC